MAEYDNFIDFHIEDEVELGYSNFDGLRMWLEKVLESEEQTAFAIQYVFCDAPRMLDLNKQYLSHDTHTDIITFDYYEDAGYLSGDIFIGVDMVKENAGLMGLSFHEELKRVMVHGILHLLGYKDATSQQKAAMRNKENYCLSLQP